MLRLHPRRARVFRDLWEFKTRTILVVLAIAIGVSAFGGMFIARQVLVYNMNDSYMSTNPATIVLSVDPFNENLLRTVRTVENVTDVNASGNVMAQVWHDGSWLTLYANVTPDFTEKSIDTIELESGTLHTGRREILLERQSAALLGVDVGDTVLIELPDNSRREMRVAGIVHDSSNMPSSIARMIDAYITEENFSGFGVETQYNTMRLVTDPELDTYLELEECAEKLKTRLERQGYTVHYYLTRLPGEHWAKRFIESSVLLLMLLGLIALTLSGFLVVNTITALVTQQKRQIGMMKAIGATRADILGIYLTLSGAFGVLALLLALPLGIGLSLIISNLLANFVNTDVDHFAVPAWIFAVQALVAVAAPLIAALFPLLKGVRITVNEAISDYGITGHIRSERHRRRLTRKRQRREKRGQRQERFNRLLSKFSRPVILSLRNTFRRRMRLALTVATLTIAGLLFTGVLNGRGSVLKIVTDFIGMFDYDIQVVLTEPQYIDRLQREALRIDGVEAVEGWGFMDARILRPPEVLISPDNPDAEFVSEEGSRLTIMAPPPDTAFMNPNITAGRWLQPGDTNAIVLTQQMIENEAYIEVGDEIRLNLGGTKRKFQVVGVVDVVGVYYGYAPFDTITRMTGTPGKSSAALLGTDSDRPRDQERIAREVEEQFQQIGIGVANATPTLSIIGTITGLMDFFVYFLILMAILMAFVGGLGLASTMSLNVLERTREIGVMRAIGAANHSVRRIFLTESILIGLMSYLASSILSVPLSFAAQYGVGMALMERPLDFVLAPVGYLIWLGIVLVLAILASLLPARRAVQISVRVALAYE